MNITIVRVLMLFLMVFAFGCKSAKHKTNAFNTIKNEVFIDSMMTNALQKGFFPGAQIIVGHKDSIFINKNFGYHDYSKQQEVISNDVYDLASISKVLGATLVSMDLVGKDKISLNDKLADLVPVYKNTAIADLSLFELLTHTSGLKASITFYDSLLSTPDGSILLSNEQSEDYPNQFGDMYVNRNIVYDSIFLSFENKEDFVQVYKNMWVTPEFYKQMSDRMASALINPRGKYVYSDLNLILAQQMLEAKTGKKLDELANEIYSQLEISNIGFNPMTWTSEKNVIPTEIDNFFRKDTIKGFVHDESAAILGGISGNAGLFSNAESIAVISQMLLNKGKFKGHQVLKPKVVRVFTKSPLAKKGIYRGIGFDKRKPNEFYHKHDFGHTGFTGTFFFINPHTDRFLVILSNRVNPTRTNRLLYEDDFFQKTWKHIND